MGPHDEIYDYDDDDPHDYDDEYWLGMTTATAQYQQQHSFWDEVWSDPALRKALMWSFLLIAVCVGGIYNWITGGGEDEAPSRLSRTQPTAECRQLTLAEQIELAEAMDRGDWERANEIADRPGC